MRSTLVAGVRSAASGSARGDPSRGMTAALVCLTIAVAHATDGYVPGRVTILFLDGHTSLPIERARLQARPGADTSVAWTRYADRHGIATMDSVPSGRVPTQFAAIGYDAKRDTLTLNGSEGHFLVVPLEASPYCLEPRGRSDGAARRQPP